VNAGESQPPRFGLEADGGTYMLSGGPAHIANIDFPGFYAEAAGGLDAARELYDSLSNPGVPGRATAKLMLHQAGRMVWLADRVKAVSEGRPALQILFYMIAAEAVAKLAVDYDGDSESWKHVLIFFAVCLNPEQRNRMHRALEWAQPPPPTSPEELADYLYGLRCDVVHEGRYFEMTVLDDVCVTAVRSVFLEGVIGASRKVARDGLLQLTPEDSRIVSRKRRS
jgi:hypothetical protein